jgi:hypothetical protein
MWMQPSNETKEPKFKLPGREMVMAGRPLGTKAIETPEKLLELFNPYKWHDYVGKDAEEVWKKRERPITWIGFEGWLTEQGILTGLQHYEQNTNDAYTDYLPVIRVIKRQCSADVITGALAGVYNQNIAARLEGLKEQSDVNLNDNRKVVGEMFPDELDKTE